MARLAARILAREAATGAALYACAGTDRATNVGIGAVAAVLLIVLSYRFGLLRRRRWTTAVAEGLLLYGGSVCIGNVLFLALGPFSWSWGG